MKPPTKQEVFEIKAKHNPAFAQQLRVKSRVIAAKTKQPVAGAFIKFPVTDYTIHSDSLGNFSVLLPDSLAGQPLRVTVVHPEHGRVSITVTSDSFPAMIELPTAPRKMEVVE